MRATLEVHGDVNADAALGVIRAAEKMGCDELVVSIASPGGDVENAFAIADAIADFPGPSVALVGANCESAALLVLCSCDYRLAYPESTFLLHNADVHRADRQTANLLLDTSRKAGAYDARVATAIAKGTGLPVPRVRKLMEREEAFTTNRAVRLGFVNAVIENERLATAALDAAFASLRSFSSRDAAR